MRTRRLGANGPQVGAIGLGAMSFGGMFGATDEATSHACLDAAVEAGIDLIDTANIYGMGVSEQVIGSWGGTARIATKCGIVSGPPRHVDNSEPYIRTCLEESLRRLKRDCVDLYYIHRRDPDVPVEEVAGTMSRLIAEGKIGGWGLSEVSPVTLRRAHAECPVAAVQSEYSLWTRQPELGLLQASADLGVAFVAFSPLGRGMFGDTPLRREDFRSGVDFRHTNPRFTGAEFAENLAMVAPFRAFCHARGWSVPAVAVAWVLGQWAHIIALPGTRTAAHLRQWADADAVDLTTDDRSEIDRLLPPGWAAGDRYGDHQLAFVERYC